MNEQTEPRRVAGQQLPAKGRQRLRSVDLLGEAREIIIEHAGEEYRLRLTSQGKLILTK